MQIICKLDRALYSCISTDIVTDEVIITDKQIEHIKERHSGDYERYMQYMALIITEPDYIIEANRPNTAFVLKRVRVEGKQFELILILHTSDDNVEYRNSVITFLQVHDKRYLRYLRTKNILYKKE